MATEEQVRHSLEEVIIPGAMRSLVRLNLVRDITIAGGKVTITVASTALSNWVQDWVTSKSKEVIGKLPGVAEVAVDFNEVALSEINDIKQVIAVMSGKGGVGKSLVAGLTALALKREGHEVGILDADITGSSIPHMFGVTAKPTGTKTGILPVVSKTGIELISVNLLLPSEDSAVIWRGPLISGVITQFWKEVLWGQLDYLIVDLPPGTTDASLTVLETLPVSGIIIVFAPGDLTAMIVRKAVNMARQMSKPIVGVVENMSYLYVAEINKKIELFGKSKAEEMAQAAGAPLLGQLPIDPALTKLCDEGEIERYDSEAFSELSQNLRQALAQVP